MEGHVELREVRGPSALGGGWRRALELLYLIAATEFKRTYFGTVLGYVWSVVRPLMLFGVLYLVFTQAFHLGGKVAHYPALLLLGVVLFGFFQEATMTAVGSIVGQESIVRKTQFPRLVIPVSVVLTAVFNLSLNLIAVFAFVLANGVRPMWSWFGLIPILLLLFMFTTAVAMIVASLYPRFRDVGIIWTVTASVLFYATPVLYPLQTLHGVLQKIVAANPLAPLFQLARKWVIDSSAPLPGSDAAAGALPLVVAIAAFVVICVAAAWIFDREAPRIAEEL